MGSRKAGTIALLARPKPSLLSSGLLAVGLVVIGLFGPLFWIADGLAATLTLAVILALFVGAAALAVVCHLRSFVRIENGRLIKRVFPRAELSIPVAEVEQVIIAEVYRGHSPETEPRFVALDESGRRMLRLHGAFWDVNDLHRIAAELGVLVRIIDTPLTSCEFFAAYPDSDYWFERRPAKGMALLALLGVGAVTVTALL